MIINGVELKNKNQTGLEMHRLVNMYSGDIKQFTSGGKPLNSIPLNSFFNLIRSLRYLQDRKPIEVISRPFYLLKNKIGLDCKKKALLMASYLKQNNVPYRFLSVSKRPDKHIHHVFTQGFFNGKWINLDCTYEKYKPGQLKNVTNSEII